jgi:hypothetical protein
LLSFTFIFFSESGLFNGLRVKKIKKLLLRAGSRSRLWAKISNSHGLPSSRPFTGEQEKDSATGNALHIFLILSSKIRREFVVLMALAVGQPSCGSRLGAHAPHRRPRT